MEYAPNADSECDVRGWWVGSVVTWWWSRDKWGGRGIWVAWITSFCTMLTKIKEYRLGVSLTPSTAAQSQIGTSVLGDHVILPESSLQVQKPRPRVFLSLFDNFWQLLKIWLCTALLTSITESFNVYAHWKSHQITWSSPLMQQNYLYLV